MMPATIEPIVAGLPQPQTVDCWMPSTVSAHAGDDQDGAAPVERRRVLDVVAA